MDLTRTIYYNPTAGSAEEAANAGTVAETLVSGQKYRLIVMARNILGSSEASPELRLALGSLPPAPTAPVRDDSRSGEDYMMLTWTEAAQTDGLSVLGYSLYGDDGYAGEFQLIYDGSGTP